jgi:signal transduction histidine kinase
LDPRSTVTHLSTLRTDPAHHAYLDQLADALFYLLDPDAVLQELARRVVPEIADYSITYLVDQESGEIRRVGLAHADVALENAMAALLDENAPSPEDAWGAGSVIRTGEPQVSFSISPDALDRLPEQHAYRKLIQTLNPISSIVLPLRARGQTVGAIALVKTTHSRDTYDADDVDFAREIARRAAIAVDNARLYAELRHEVARRQSAEARLRARYDQLRLVYQMTRAVTTTDDVEQIYEEALRALEEGAGTDRASVLLFDPDGVIRFKAWSKLSEEYRAAVEGHSPWAVDTKNPQPIVVADVETDPSIPEDVRESVLREGIRALVFIPLLFGRSLLGKFMLYFDRPHAPPLEEIEMAQTIAGTIAFAIARMKDEQSVRTAKEAAERASQAKSQFLGVMSHELRTPLNSVYGYTDLLLLGTKGELTEAQAEYVRRIQSSAAHQLKLIEELLAYTRLEAGYVGAVRPIRTDVRRIVADVLEFVRPEAEHKGLSLRQEVPETQLEAHTDPARLRQIVLNLVGNATKFTEAGEIVVCASVAGEHVCLEVRDTGPGIPHSELDRIWEPFAQVIEGRHRPGTGTGLGLSIARKYAEMLGAHLSVESALGSGSTFTLRLPHTADDAQLAE